MAKYNNQNQPFIYDLTTSEKIPVSKEVRDEYYREVDPDADTIIAMWMDNDSVSDCTIAKALGRPQRTFADQMKKYRVEFRRIRGY